MIYVLVLRALLGPAIVGHFDTEQECEKALVAYMAMLKEQRSDEKHGGQLGCVGFPIKLPEPKEWKEA